MAKKRGSSLSSPMEGAIKTVMGSTQSSEAVTVEHKRYIGVVAQNTGDILSSPMGGQRRTTGVRESVPSTLGVESKKKG